MSRPKTPEHSEPDEAQVASLVKWGREVTRCLQTQTIDAAWAHEQYEAKSDGHVFDHELVCACDSQLIFTGKSNAAKFSESPCPMAYFWPNRLCPMWTLSIFNWERGKTWRAFIVNNSREFELFRNKPVKVLLLWDDKCVAALEIDLASANPELWSEPCSRASRPYQHLGDAFGGKVYAQAWATIPRSPEEHLKKGWATRLDYEAGLAYKFLNDPDLASGFEEEKARLSKIGFGSMFASDNALGKLYEFYQYRFWIDGDGPVAHARRLQKHLRECPLHHDAAQHILECAWFSAKGTSAGQRIQSVDLDGSIRPVPIDAQGLGDKCEVFWSRGSISKNGENTL
jgi:hypothetical protein